MKQSASSIATKGNDVWDVCISSALKELFEDYNVPIADAPMQQLSIVFIFRVEALFKQKYFDK